MNQLKRKISSVEPEFRILNEIRDLFQGEIRKIGEQKAKAIADSFKDYVLNLGNTFETDFIHYQPDLHFLDQKLTQAFESYINDKLSEWSLSAEKKMDSAFSQLSQIATSYGDSYSKVTDKITEKLTGHKITPEIGSKQEDNAPAWAKWAAGLFSLARGNIAGVAMAGAGFDWKNIVLNFITVFGVGSIITAVTGVVLGPIGLALLGLGVGVMQADQARKELIKVTKKELIKYLPQVAQEQSPRVYDAIKECFDTYEKEITERINDDIKARQAELDNLLKQKESFEINQVAEIERLNTLKTDVNSAFEGIEIVYENFVKAIS